MKNTASFDLVIPEEVEAKIRHLCARVHDIEWSGTLFYTVTGSLDDGTFKATCVDIFVMDIGTTGATEYKDSEDIIAYRMEHKDTLLVPGVYEALIHSHNNMAAFFSSVDENTLIAEGSDMNHFLSLVVCNAGKYVARITRKLKTVIEAEAIITYKKSVQYNTFEDRTVVLSDNDVSQATQRGKKEETIIEYFELNIDKAEVSEPFREVDERLAEIKKNKSSRRYYGSYGSYTGSTSTSRFHEQFDSLLEKPEEKTEKEDEEKQLSIFNREDMKSMVQKPEKIDIDDSLDFYMLEKVPMPIVKVLCTQLLCGSILASTKTNINLNDWVPKMDKLYEERFGSLDDTYNVLRLRNWIEALLENILYYSVDKKFEDKIAKKYNLGDDYEYEESDAFPHLYACDMILYLDDLPESFVKEIMLEELVKLMPPEYEDNFRI